MEGSERNGCNQFFLQPSAAWHRRYEALRAVFVDDEPPKDVAMRFQLSYGTIRNWVSKFRKAFEQGQTPPCFHRRTRAPLRLTTKLSTTRSTRTTPSRRSPMSSSCRSK